jgi:hypothetical protein
VCCLLLLLLALALTMHLGQQVCCVRWSLFVV